MDEQRFDLVARTLAAGITRRSVAGAFAAAAGWAALAGRTVRAQSALAPGEPCTSDDQCDQTLGAQVCGDNGLNDDGPLNCCRLDSGACARDNDCCGNLLCKSGLCLGDVPQAAGWLVLGAPCENSGQCAASAAGTVVCGDNLMPEDGALTCCLERGGACAVHNECCGDWDCEQGFCGGAAAANANQQTSQPPRGAVSPEDGDLAPGDACMTSDQCSQALGPASCGTNGEAGPAVCCLAMASPCTNDLECCDDLVCAENGVSGDGGFNCCGYVNAACASDQGCCADLFCLGGVCQPLF